MLALPQHGFVFLSTTKSASTAIEEAFAFRAAIAMRHPPPLKHMTASAFIRQVAPILEKHRYPRDSYELVCVVREPVDWTASWWRYWSRPDALNTSSYTGDLSFDEFVDQVVDGRLRIGNLSRFVRDPQGDLAVSRMFRYDRLEGAVSWMAEQIGIPVPNVRRWNVSPVREVVISRSTRARIEEHYSGHVALYEAAR